MSLWWVKYSKSLVPDTTLPNRKIRQLPIQLANQIAAGEVVERPASVVKELVENSIDARATKIIIDIEKGGHKKISIRDNGNGIVKDDISLALSRHATSKIYSLDELESIHTMGFRGEALASISSVSRCALTSKPKQQDNAWRAFTDGLDMQVKTEPAAHPNGTTVEVIDLFFNTPARRRFLRAQKTEFNHIEKTVKRIALAHSDIAFELIHNGKSVLKLAQTDVFKRIQRIFKQADAQHLIPFEFNITELSIKGWTSEVGYGADTNENQYLFINHRMMKDRLLMHAIRQAYEGMLPDAKHPSFVIFIDMAPDLFDVNVHPAKHEVRFHHARDVHAALYQAINDAIYQAMQTANNESDAFDSSTQNNKLDNTPLRAALDERIESHYQATHDYIRTPERINPSANDSAGGHKVLENLSSNASVQSHPSFPRRGTSNFRSPYADESHNVGLYESESKASQSRQSMPVICMGEHSLLKHGSAVYLQSNVQLARCFLHANQGGSNDDTLVKQPLLMPVTVKPDYVDDTVIEKLSQYGFDVQNRNGKLVLLQVPAHLKHLPWPGMFSNIVAHFYTIKTIDVLGMVAQAWCSQIAVDENMINYWLTRFDSNDARWLAGARKITETTLEEIS